VSADDLQGADQGRHPRRASEPGAGRRPAQRPGIAPASGRRCDDHARETDAPPLLCLQHFRGNLDNWDPALVAGLAGDREVILLANRGVGASSGVVPDNVEDMARDVLRFVDALSLRRVDLLGFSLGPAAYLPGRRPRFLDQYPEQFADHVRAFLNGG
jgi:pimeloyl-ACP methyl ester carboxylesterase